MADEEDLGVEGLVEASGQADPGDGGFSIDGGKFTMDFWSLEEELTDNILTLLGDTEYESGPNGMVQRRMPLAHPRFPWLYCSRVSSVKGWGKWEDVETEAEWYDAPPPERWGRRRLYRLSGCEFTPRPYAVLSDDSVRTEEVTWYDEEGSAFVTQCPAEWERFFDLVDGEGQVDLVTCQFGQAKLRLGGAAADDKLLNYSPSTRQPRSSVVGTWFQVPQKWVRSPGSWLRKCLGTVNQSEFLGYPAGWLCLLSYRTRAYQPAVPSYEPSTLGYVVEKMCDVQFTWGVAPRTAAASVTPSRAGVPIDGWQTAPNYTDLLHYYVSAVTDPDSAEDGAALFRATEHRLMFRDPEGIA